LRRAVRLTVAVSAAVSVAVLTWVLLEVFFPSLSQSLPSVLLDTTPRTSFSTASLLAQIRGLPAESLGFLALAGLAAVMGFIADLLY